MNGYTPSILKADPRLKSEPSTWPERVGLAVVAPPLVTPQELGQFYRVEVRTQGTLVTEHVIVAANAINAINLVESEYGEPVQAETTLLENGHGLSCKVVVAKNWHGYTFEARAVSPALV